MLALLGLNCYGATVTYPERNPLLGKYQDESQCFPLQETWYMLYRNYAFDPAFGGTAKCVRFTNAGPEVNGAYPLVISFGNSSNSVTATLGSSPGYTAKNIINLKSEGQNTSLSVYDGYMMCKECAILRFPYANENACGLLVPESQLGKDITCCRFVFDLICGTTPKYIIYDESC
ncbi:uncharacterized protein ISCGN_011523 [Ixodes scapularis]